MDTLDRTARFVFPAGASPTIFLRHLRRAGYEPEPPGTLRSRADALFLDTQDGRLLKARCRLSLRQTEDGTAWVLAAPAGEQQSPCAGADPATPFQRVPTELEIPPRVQELIGGRRLLPLLRLKLLAWDASLRAPSGDLVEIRIERFLAAAPGGPWPPGPWPHGLLSVRVPDGRPDALHHLGAYVRDRLQLLPADGDACRIGLRALGLPEPGAPLPARLRLKADDSLATAARKVMGQQLLKMEANLQGTLDDADIEYLHDLRVATRRLRSALRLFSDVLGSARCESLREELRWIAERLGAVRDLDVFIENLHGQASHLDEGAPIAELLAAELARRRQPRRAELVAALTSRRSGALMRRLQMLAASRPPRFPRGSQGMPVSAAAPLLLLRAQKRVLTLGRAVDPGTPAADLHRLRILFKRLRYACEFFREAFADPGSGRDPVADYLETMVRFQDCLGQHQDAAVAIGRIQELAREMVRQGSLSPDQLLHLGGLIQVQREIARQRRDELLTLWKQFDKRSVRGRLTALRPSSAAPIAREASSSAAEGNGD